MDPSQPTTKFMLDEDNQQAPSATGMTAPIVSVGGEATTTVPIMDTTTVPTVEDGVRSPSQGKGTTRIEGMEALYDHAQMSESEKRMAEEELSFYSASENEHGDDNIWGLLSGVGGNIYEWYVFLICSFFGCRGGQLSGFKNQNRKQKLVLGTKL